jgi:hypothetical protein
MNNVIHFPKMKKDTPPQTIEEVNRKAIEYRKDYSIEFSERLANQIFNEMARDGIDFEKMSPELFPCITLVMESILALHLKGNRIEHPLQDLADEMFGDEDEEEDSPVVEEEKELTET